MTKRSTLCFFIFSALILSGTLSAQQRIADRDSSVIAEITPHGTIVSFLSKTVSPSATPIEFRSDSLEGPSLFLNGKKLELTAGSLPFHFKGRYGGIEYGLSYTTGSKGLAINVTCTNSSGSKIDSIRFSLLLGINTEMKSYPEWREKFFPTLLRCEKTHFWGYLMTPEGRVLTLSSPSPVASYRMYYNNSRMFAHGHLIRTVSLDLLHPGPLPQRHPDGNGRLLAGETRNWTIYLEEAGSMEEIKPTILQNTGAPAIHADFYTLFPGEKSSVTVYALSEPEVIVQTPDGKNRKIKVVSAGTNRFAFDFSPEKKGVYTFKVTDKKNKKVSEARISCLSNFYGDYIKSARRAAVKYPQQASSNNESWYGFFSGYIAGEHFPDAEWDSGIEEKFRELYPLLYDTVTNIPVYNMQRIQNHALMAALLTQKYKAKKDISDLQRAADLADYILAMQSPDGAYRNGKTHYTSVIYIAKALMEVMEQEKKKATGSEVWTHRYRRHYHSVKKAIDELVKNLDNIQTEGEMTFEDGMISCSYTQIAQFALLQPEGSPEREAYTRAAEEMLRMHRCLSQLQIPDSRMNGASLRYWEAQYDILASPNMMNSPHGWSAWRIYGLKYLYELTGKYEYLRQMMNAIGSCIQLLEPETDKLNWAFIADPYIQANIFTEDPAQPGKGIYCKQVIGEQYLPMISDWNRAAPHTLVSGYWKYDGGKCDNDVHEIFKCLGEILLTNAYVMQLPDGTVSGFNCRVINGLEGIKIEPREAVVTNLHVNLEQPAVIDFAGQKFRIPEGFRGWISDLRI